LSSVLWAGLFFRSLVPASERQEITASVDDKVLDIMSFGTTASFEVSGGVHKVLIVK
jgi:hypothetical protein